MTFALTWLPQILEAAGLKVAEVPGWRTSGRGEMGEVTGVMLHHTVNDQIGNMPSLRTLINGRKDLAGPLCQLGLGRDGTFYVISAGRANHAGKGIWQGVPQDSGNWHMIGIEAENGGGEHDTWPPEQYDACIRGVAAILAYIKAPSGMCCGHKEYAPTRKVDPRFDMAVFRTAVAEYLVGKTPPPPIPATDPQSRPTLRRGARGDAVTALQRAIGIDPDGIFGPATEAALRAKQRTWGLVPDGIAGPKTWAMSDSGGPAEPATPPPAATTDPGGRQIGANGIKLIQYFEQCERKQADGTFRAYPDPGSKDGKPWTIGWGSTGADITPDTIWTAEQCDARFATDMESYAAAVRRAIGDAATSQNQFDALVSFHYNTGAIATATLTKRHIAKDYAGAAEAFAWWNKNDGRVLNGLVRRRASEAKLYGTPDGAAYDGPP